MTRSKGSIELEMNLIYNPVRFYLVLLLFLHILYLFLFLKIKAVIKTLNPREEKYIQNESKLKIPVLKQNIVRVHNLVQGIINTGSFIDSCFRWVNPIRSCVAFLVK